MKGTQNLFALFLTVNVQLQLSQNKNFKGNLLPFSEKFIFPNSIDSRFGHILLSQ